MSEIREVTAPELAAFVAELHAKINALDHERFPECPPNWRKVYADRFDGVTRPTGRYARVCTTNEIHRDGGYNHASVYCFVDLTNGDILKAATFKAPAKHARGNIREGDASNFWKGALGIYGAAYLR